MNEMIAELINGKINTLLFYLPFILVPAVLFTLMYKIKKMRPKKMASKISIYAFLCAALLAGLIGFIPTVVPTINLVKDYNDPVILSNIGNVDDRIIRAKQSDFIRIDNEMYIQSPDIEKLEEGNEYEIHYLKNSKYIFKAKLINDDQTQNN